MEFSRILEPFPSPGDLPTPGIEPRSPTLQADSLLSGPPGKPKKPGVGSLSLLQGIFQPRDGTGVSRVAGGFFLYVIGHTDSRVEKRH